MSGRQPGVEPNRKPSQFYRLGRGPGPAIIVPRRSSSVHLRRPWRANCVQNLEYFRSAKKVMPKKSAKKKAVKTTTKRKKNSKR